MNIDNSKANFAECILLPSKEYSRLRELDKTKHVETKSVHDILSNDQISDNMKLKLVNHVNLSKKSTLVDTKPTKKYESRWENLLPHFSDHIAAGKILWEIEKNPEHLDWDTNSLKIAIDNKTIDGTNIVKLLQYFLNQTIVTSEKDKPKAYQEFGKALSYIGVPQSWVKQPLKRSNRTAKRRTDTNTQRNVRSRTAATFWEEYN